MAEYPTLSMIQAYSLDLLNDDAIYQRTPAGQRELVDPHSRLSRLELRFLAAVTGHTPLRVLLDLGLDQIGIGESVVRLYARGFIKQVPPCA